MPAWLAPLAIAGGSGLLNALFGEDDRFDMSPEQRRMLNMLLREYQGGEFGPSFAEQSQLQKRLKEGLQEQAQTRTGSSLASMARRGTLSPGQASGLTTDIQSGFGEAYGKGVTDIQLGSAEIARREKGQVRGLLGGLSQGQYIPGRDVPGLGGAGQNALLYYLLRGQGQGGGG
jgi:hypothetical protein